MNLNYKKLGDGEPLIILHGLFGSLDNWITLAKKISENYQVFIIDARNHGQSPHSDIFNYEVMADDLNEFILLHNIDNPTVLGHSMGGKTAMQFAMNYPHQLAKLIVADIAPKDYPVHHQQIIEGLFSLGFEKIKTRKEADAQLSKYISDFSVRQFLLKNLYWVEKDKLAWRFNLKAINDNIEMIGKKLENIIPFNKPTLFLIGEKSNYILESDYPQIKEIFPQAVIKTINNSGHWVHAENPNQFLNFIQDFLDGDK